MEMSMERHTHEDAEAKHAESQRSGSDKEIAAEIIRLFRLAKDKEVVMRLVTAVLCSACGDEDCDAMCVYSTPLE
jgi:hypothetical protein